jgi:hypothetical protein
MNDYRHHKDTYTLNDRFAHLKGIASGKVTAPALSSAIKFWTHEPEQPLIGSIVGFSHFEHERYGTQATVLVERETGEVVSAILTGYLQRGIEIQDGAVGDLILIVKQGQACSKYGNMYNKFQLVIDKQ